MIIDFGLPKKCTILSLTNNLQRKLVMNIYRIKPKNNILIVDEKGFREMERLADMNKKNIESLVNERNLNYVRKNGIHMNLRINDAEIILRHKVLFNETNYDERGYPTSIREDIKYFVVDSITDYVNKTFADKVKECQDIVKSNFNKYKQPYESKIRLWKSLFIITFFLLLAECISHYIN